MDRIGVRELRQNASRYLKRVESGETLEVTDRGRPVARIIPVARIGVERLIAEGRVRAPTGDFRELPPPLPLPEGMEPPSLLVSRMRDE
jgi:prevent-host-death family protein